MINLSQDIQSLSTFKRNSNELINQMKTTGNPIEDLNKETQEAIKNIEKGENITTCQDKNDLYNQLDL